MVHYMMCYMQVRPVGKSWEELCTINGILTYIWIAHFQVQQIDLQELTIDKVLLFVYKSLHGQGPEYLTELLVPYAPPRTLRSATEDQLSDSRCNYEHTRKRAVSIGRPTKWNKPPQEVKSCTSVNNLQAHPKETFYQTGLCIEYIVYCISYNG